VVVMVAALLASACAKLPEPESPGARLYSRRCQGCHRLYQPGTMTADMWTVQVDRMQHEFIRQGIPPLTAGEREELLSYLHRHGYRGS